MVNKFPDNYGLVIISTLQIVPKCECPRQVIYAGDCDLCGICKRPREYVKKDNAESFPHYSPGWDNGRAGPNCSSPLRHPSHVVHMTMVW